MLKTRSVLLAETEVTYNTDPTPSNSTNAILVENLGWSFAGARMADRSKSIKPYMAPLKNLYAGSLMEVTFDVEIKGSGAAGTAPELGPLLKACGFEETVVASTSVTYTPTSDPTEHKSLTFWIYEDGLLYKITGARGTFTLDLSVAQVGKFSFKFSGHFTGPTDAAIVTPTYNSTVPPVVIGAAFAVDSYSAVITKLSVDPGLELATPDNIAATDGYGEIRITGMAPTFSVDPEAALVAAYDWVTKWKSSAAYSMSSGTIGSTAGNRYTVTAPAAVYSEVANGDRSNIITREIKGQLVDTTGDNWLSIAFT